MDVTNFLLSFVNKAENTQSLIALYTNRCKYQFGSLFCRLDSGEFNLIDHLSPSNNPTPTQFGLSYKPPHPLTGPVLSTDGAVSGYLAPFAITNMMVIPIYISTVVVGAICLGHSTGDKETLEDDISDMSDLIGLTQLIVNKYKLIEDYKKDHSDSNELFLDNMSNSIRNPLNGIVGHVQLLMETDTTDTQKSYIAAANHCSIQLMRVINDILDFVRLSSGKMKITTECFSVKGLMAEITDTMSGSINHRKHTLSVVIDSQVPGFIIMDKQKLTQIIINLLSNAVNYTDPSGAIGVEITPQSADMLRVSVTDNGIGIAEQDQGELFRSFSQIPGRNTTGHGLGLSISKRLVELLNGTINLESSPGDGSTFSFTCKHTPVENFDDVFVNQSEVLKGVCVLVVDSDADNRIYISDLLFGWGMHPVVCSSRREAINMVTYNRYNFSMGFIDDGDTGRQIKSIDCDLPLVAMSGGNQFNNTDDYEAKVSRPVNKIQMFNIIHRLTLDSAYLGTRHALDIHRSSGNKTSDARILISDSILYNRTMLSNMVKSIGYTNVTEACSGAETVSMVDEAEANRNPFQILLLDMRMPVMSGYDVMEHIHKKGYQFPHVVTVTTCDREEDKERCHSLGVQYFITKPIDMGQLKMVLRKVSIAAEKEDCDKYSPNAGNPNPANSLSPEVE